MAADATTSVRGEAGPGEARAPGPAPARRRGRPPGGGCKLTPAVADKIIDGVRRGLPLKYASQLAGVGVRTVARWKQQGAAGNPPDCVAFAARLKEAESSFVDANIAIIQQAATKSWQAAAWLLERLRPDQFSRDADTVQRLRKILSDIEASREPTKPAPPG